MISVSLGGTESKVLNNVSNTAFIFFFQNWPAENEFK